MLDNRKVIQKVVPEELVLDSCRIFFANYLFPHIITRQWVEEITKFLAELPILKNLAQAMVHHLQKGKRLQLKPLSQRKKTYLYIIPL